MEEIVSEKVSIVMPVYNVESLLAETLESILAQTHKNFVLIAVDDGSTDGSYKILEQYAAKDSRIEVLRQENQGNMAARNRGLKHAKTEWVFQMDSDDVMFPNRIERQLDFIRRHPDIRACSSLARYIDEKGRVFGTTPNSIPSVEAFNSYLRRGEPVEVLNPGAVVHRETVISIGGYRNIFIQAGDIDLWNRLAEKGHLILVQNEVLMKYRIHNGSITTSNFLRGQKHVEWVCACMRARKNNEVEPDWDTFLEEWESAPLWTRTNRWRKIYSKALYRHSGRAILNGRKLRGFCGVALATVLRPTYTLPRMINQVFSRNR